MKQPSESGRLSQPKTNWLSVSRKGMKRCTAILMVFVSINQVFAQPAASKYERGTIMSVTPHRESGPSNHSIERFDVDVRVGNVMYTVLFTQRVRTYGIQYRAGLDLFVLIKHKTMTYNDLLGETKKVPIIGRKPVPEQKSNVPPEPGRR